MTMRDRSQQPTGGFTLIELLIAMSIFLLILLGIYNVFDTNRQTYLSGTRKVDVQQNARVALDQIAREIRMAGYFPENFPSATLVNPQPIQIAQNFALAILGDADGSGASKVFLYCLTGTNVIRKWTALTGGAVTGPAQAYTCSEETVPNVRVGAVLGENIANTANVIGLRFTYYDGNNLPIPNPMPTSKTTPYTLDGEGLNFTTGVGATPVFGATVQRGAVRTVVITIVATESVPGPGQQPQSFTLTSSVRLRNL
jgi:prepilin-type N-terminal cleavage/methylation domain-containing protein